MGDVVFKLSAEEGAAVNAFLKVVDAQKKVEHGFDSMGRASSGAGKQAESSMDKAIGGLQRWAASLVSVAAAVEMLRKVWANMEAERQRGLEGVKGSAAGKTDLVSLVGPGRSLPRMLRDVESSRNQGMTSDEAAKLQYTLETSGQQSKRQLYASLTGDRAALAESVAKIQGSMGAQAGDTYGILNRLTIAAGRGGVRREAMGQIVAGAAVQGKAAGASTSELMAALAVSSDATKSDKQAASYVESMAAVIAEKGFGGRRGLVAGVQDIAGRGWSDKKLREKLGGAYEAYSFFRGREGEISGVRGEMFSRDALREQWSAEQGSAELRTLKAARIADERRKVKEETAGYREMEDKIALDRKLDELHQMDETEGGVGTGAWSRASLELMYGVGQKIVRGVGAGPESAVEAERQQQVQVRTPPGIQVKVEYRPDPNRETE